MLAVVFPGQGSQSVGMALDFAERHSEARDALDEADAALGFSLTSLLEKGPEAELARTEVTQPAILAASVAMWRVVAPRLPVAPALLAGHSLGEYTALVAARSLALADAVKLVRRRGELMQAAVPEGRGEMAAVLGLDGERVAEVCAGIPGVVAPANHNSSVQTVIAGEREAVRAACRALEAAGAKRTVRLPVSAPFHCALMRPAQEGLGPELDATPFRDLDVPVVSNVTARPYRTAAEARRLLREQVCAPVRWVECVRRLRSEGARVQLEVGPGKVLSGLAPRIERDLARANVEKVGDLDDALRRVAEALA